MSFETETLATELELVASTLDPEKRPNVDQNQKRLKLTIRGHVDPTPNAAYHSPMVAMLFEGKSNGVWLSQGATVALLHDLQKMTRPKSVSEIPTSLRLGDGATTFEIISPESRASEVENQIMYNTSLPGAIEHNRRVIAAAIRAAEDSIGNSLQKAHNL